MSKRLSLALALAALLAGCGNRWDPSFKRAYEQQFITICLGNGIPLVASQDIARCIVNRAERSYSQQEFLMLDANPAGLAIGQQLARDCMCSNTTTRPAVLSTYGCP